MILPLRLPTAHPCRYSPPPSLPRGALAWNVTYTRLVSRGRFREARTHYRNPTHRSYYGPLPFAETFDASPTLPAGWAVTNPNGTFTWMLVDNVVNRLAVASRIVLAPYSPMSAVYPDSVVIQVEEACSQMVLGKA